MATPVVGLERLAVHSPLTFLCRKSFRTSIVNGNRGLRGSWNFSGAAQGLGLGVARLQQDERSRRWLVIGAKKEPSHNGVPRENGEPDVKFDSMDMMELEFGRLLGEDRQTTLAKVLGKKMNSELTYVKIQKKKELMEEKESARLSSPPRISAPSGPDFKPKETAKDYPAQRFEQSVPDLVSPPVRPRGFKEVDASPVQKNRAVRSGGGKKLVSADPHALDGLIRKPMRVSEAEKGLPPARPEKPVIAPVLMRREAPSVDVQPKPGDSLLRKPTLVRLNSFGEPLNSEQTPISLSVKEVQSAVELAVAPDDISEESFRQLLDGELSLPRQEGQSTTSKRSIAKRIPPTDRSLLPTLENKPTIYEKPQKVFSRENLIGPGNSANSTGVEFGPVLQDSEVPNPQPTVLSRPRAKLSKPHSLRQQTDLVVAVVTEVPSVKTEENIAENMQTDNVISLEESTLKVQVAERILHKDACPANTSGGDAKNGIEETTSLLPVLKLEGVDPLLGDVDVKGFKNEDISEAAAGKPVMRLRKTSLPLQQPFLSKDNRNFIDSKHQDTTSAQDIYVEDQATCSSNSASERQEEGSLLVREQGIKQERQENTMYKTRQVTPNLKLSRPASPRAFISKKDALGDTTLSNLQKAINSFDEKKFIPNKRGNDEDWARAEALRDSKAIEELEIIGTGRGGLLNRSILFPALACSVLKGHRRSKVVFCSNNGTDCYLISIGDLEVGFGSLVGYLPAFELKAERRPASFTVWAQSKGYDAKKRNYTQDEENLDNGRSTTTSVESTTPDVPQASGGIVDALEQRSSTAIDPELLEQFKKERATALSLLVGQKAKVIIILVDRTLRQLRFSEKQAAGEGQELSQRKATLMESLNVGDVVTCQVKKITTFGAFVDLKGVPALIHTSELSWNRNTDPLSVLQVGQEVKVKVCKLDRFLQRINLSLKLMQPDPLLETLESLVSPDADMIGASADVKVEENEDLNMFIRKLVQIPGIVAISSGRRVRGAALAPAFQIYLSSHLDNGYKLLARFGNEVQEVLVETSADRDQMKEFIHDCTVQDT